MLRIEGEANMKRRQRIKSQIACNHAPSAGERRAKGGALFFERVARIKPADGAFDRFLVVGEGRGKLEPCFGVSPSGGYIDGRFIARDARLVLAVLLSVSGCSIG